MKAFFSLSSIALTLALAAIASAQQGTQNVPGVTISQDDQKQEAKIQANLSKLSPADRKAAEEQKFCAVQTKNRLGAMGAPVKITIKGQPVFLCCDDCVAEAKANPDKTLASVAGLIKANK